MNIPSSKSNRYNIVNYEDVDPGSENDTDVEKDGEDADGEQVTDDHESTTGRGRRRIPSMGSFSGQPIWPQSYRASMDYQILSVSSSEKGSFSLFSPIARISNSYMSSSAPKRRTLTGSSTTDLGIPFLPSNVEQGLQGLPGQKHLTKIEGEVDLAYIPSKVDDLERLRQEHGSSFMQALLNGLNVLAGVGVLSTPYALKEGGYLGLTILYAPRYYLLLHGDFITKMPGESAWDGNLSRYWEAAFGPTGRLIISIVLYVELYACCVEFVILEGDNLAALFPGTTLDFFGIHLETLDLFCIIAALIILPTVWLRDLSLLSYLSAGGVLATFVVVFVVFWVGTVDGVGFQHTGPLLNLGGLPVSVGLYGFCYAGHAVFPNIYASMKKPADFNKVLQLSFLIVSTIYGVVAVMGYTMFGNDIQSSITLNLPKEFIASKIAVWTIVINPITKSWFLSIPILSRAALSVAVRTALVASTVFVAIMVPFFGYVMAFIGAFMSISVSVLLPTLCYLRIAGDKAPTSQWIACSLVILVGVVCAIVGTYSSVNGIIESFMEA